MPEQPDFDQIADRIVGRIDVRAAGGGNGPSEIAWVVEQLRLIWNAGFEAGGQHETFVKHLKDENNAAHLALDRLDAPKTRQVPSRNFDGGKQEITIGLAERINATGRQVWNARGAADLALLGEHGPYGPPLPDLKKLDR